MINANWIDAFQVQWTHEQLYNCVYRVSIFAVPIVDLWFSLFLLFLSLFTLLFIQCPYCRFLSLPLWWSPNRYLIFIHFVSCLYIFWAVSFYISLSFFSLHFTLLYLISNSLSLHPYHLSIFPLASLLPLANLSITFANHLIHHSSSHLNLVLP